MNFNILTNILKNKINNLQTAAQKKTLKISDIVLIPEFEKCWQWMILLQML